MTAQQEAPAGETKVLLTWKALSRPFKKRSRDFFTTIGAIAFLLCVVFLFVAGSWPLIAVIVSLTFLVFVLNTIPPEVVENKITNKAIITAGNEYLYKDLISFFFTQKNGETLLNIGSKKRFYGRLIFLLTGVSKDQVKEILNKYLDFKEKPDKNFVDDAANWLSEKIPLEK